MTTTTVTDKRRAILRATLDLVAEHGFHHAPVAAVARGSGVSAGIIYHYFEDKDDLIRALYREVKGEVAAAFLAGDVLALPWPANIFRLWRNAFEFHAGHPKETAFLEQYESSPYATAWDEGHLRMNEDTAALIDLIGRGMEAGHIAPMPMEVLYELTVGVAVRLAKRQIAGTIELDEVQLNRIAAACYRAVSPDSP
jgi:AcrR family transcriptional regulator